MPAWHVLTTIEPCAERLVPVQSWLLRNGVAETRQGVLAAMHDVVPEARVIAMTEVIEEPAR